MTRAGWAKMVDHKVVQARKVLKDDIALAEALLIESEAILARFPDMNVWTKKGRTLGNSRARVARLRRSFQREKARRTIVMTSSSSELRLAWARTGIHTSFSEWTLFPSTPAVSMWKCVIKGFVVPESLVFEIGSSASTQVGCWCGVAHELKKIASNRGVTCDEFDVLFAKLAVDSFEYGPINSRLVIHPTLTKAVAT